MNNLENLKMKLFSQQIIIKIINYIMITSIFLCQHYYNKFKLLNKIQLAL